MDGNELVNFGCNDYLGLADDERLRSAARVAVERYGWGSGASPLVSGRSEIHAELERQLAEFEETEAALVFPSGFAANAGIIPALVDNQDAIFSDAKNHASLVDGCRLSKASRFVYPHADCDALETMLQDAGRFRRRLVVTDTLFSMDGDLAPLGRLADLADRYECMLMIDEAHATGVFGEHGRGVAESAYNRELLFSRDAPAERVEPVNQRAALHHRIHIRVGTLSKALGSAGGFVCGRQSLIDWLANRARSYVFSTAQPAANCAAALAALEIVRNEPHRRSELLARAAALRLRLREHGWQLVAGSREQEAGSKKGERPAAGSPLPAPRSQLISQIIALIIGDPDRTMRLAARLRDAGFFVPGIRPPSVPEGESLLRVSLCYHHSAEMIDSLIDELSRLR
jgi:8-amino-7-oxononanoate synthase